MGCSVGFKYAKNALPDPTGGAHDAPPDLLVNWGGGHQSQCHTPRRLWHFPPSRGSLVHPSPR